MKMNKNNKLKIVNLLLILGVFFIVPFFVFAQITCPSQTTYTSNSAVLVGEIRDTGGDQNINAWFEWGTSLSLGNQTASQSLNVSYTPFRFCSSISNLQPCTTYYYRAVASNSGGLNLGQIFSFRTRCVTGQVTTNQSILTSNQPPVAIIKYSPQRITPGTRVTFNALSSYDPDGYIVAYTWKVNGNVESNRSIFVRSLSSGTYEIELIVKDNDGNVDSEKLIISVGRNIFRTRTITRTVVKTKPIYLSARADKTNNLVNLTFKDPYQIQKCSPSDINFTLINNTSVKRKITIEVEGEAKSWFDPQQREFTLNPEEKLDVNWKIYPPCQISEDKYLVTFKLTTFGFTKNYQTALEVKSQEAKNPLSAFASLIFNNFPWFLVFVLIIINSVLLFTYYTRKKTLS